MCTVKTKYISIGRKTILYIVGIYQLINIIHVFYFFDHLLFIPVSFENLLIINNSLLELPVLLVEFKCISVDVMYADSIGFVLGIGNDDLELDMGHDEFISWEFNRISTVAAAGCFCSSWDDCKFCMTDVWTFAWQGDVGCGFPGSDNRGSSLDKKNTDDGQLGMDVLKPKVDNTSGNVSTIVVCILVLLYVLFIMVGLKT